MAMTEYARYPTNAQSCLLVDADVKNLQVGQNLIDKRVSKTEMSRKTTDKHVDRTHLYEEIITS